MKVGVIAGEMERRSTGVGRYLTGLLRSLSQWDHGIEWHLFFQGEPYDDELWEIDGFSPHFCRYPGRRVVWEQWVVSRHIARHDLDLLFAPANTVPFGVRIPAVVTIHDLSFELCPEEFRWRERWRRRLLARRAGRMAHRVLSVSHRVADQLHRLYGVERRRIGVVPLGIDRNLLTTSGSDTLPNLESLGVHRPYLLSAGTILQRRLPRLVLEACSELFKERSDLQIVIAGDNRLRHPGRLQRWVKELGLVDRVRLLGWVDDSTLAALYRSAELSLYVSTYEGFGIPPLESLAFGSPALVGPGLALDEIWPDYPYRVSRFERADMVDMMRRMLGDPAGTADVIDSARGVLARLDWRDSSRRLVEELGRAVQP